MLGSPRREEIERSEADEVHRGPIVDILAQASRDDVTARDICRIHGISEQTLYRWKHRYGDTQRDIRAKIAYLSWASWGTEDPRVSHHVCGRALGSMEGFL